MAGSGSLLVLVVDDERLSRESTLELLGRAPELEVVGTAANGVEAVEAARRLRPDVIVMDLYMPLLDGIAATGRIVADRPETRVVLHTSSDQPGDEQRAHAAGAAGWVRKQDAFELLVETILSVAGRGPDGTA